MKKQKDKGYIEMKCNWGEVTLGEFLEIDEIRNSDSAIEDKALEIVSVLCGQPVEWLENQSITFVSKLTHMIDFLSTDVPKISKKDKYTINGRVYKLDCDLSNITTARYFDYQNYMKAEQKDLRQIISVWLVPDGHEYNDGYDMDVVFKDMNDIKIMDYYAIANFQLRQLAAFILVSASCLTQEEMKMIPMKKLDPNSDLKAQLVNMASYLWSLGAVN